MRKLRKELSYFIVTLLAAFLFVTVTPLNSVGIDNTNVAVAATKINITKVNLPKGSTYKLQMTGTKAAVAWSTSNKAVATVKNGVVTGKKAGKAVITAKVGKKKYTCTVTVLNYKVNSNNLIMTKGKSYTLKVTGASKKDKIKFKSSKTSVASVNSKTGKITAKNNGSATITVTVGKTSFPVLVKVETPSISTTKLTLTPKKTYTLKVNSARKPKWKSNNTSVATVSSSGKVTALKKGSAVITATLSDKVLSCTVNVGYTTVINCPSTITIGLGETKTYTMTAGDSFSYSSTKQFVSTTVSPMWFYAGDNLTLKVTGEYVGSDTLTFTSEGGWKKVVNVNVTGKAIPASSISEVFNNVKISNVKAYKGTNNNWLNVQFNWTNNSTLTLKEQTVAYTFYDAAGKELRTYSSSMENPVYGKTYTCNHSFDPSIYTWTSNVASVKITEVDNRFVGSLVGSVVSPNVKVTVETKVAGMQISDTVFKQSYRTYTYNGNYSFNNIYDFTYSFNLKNTSSTDARAICYYYFYDKEGKLITQEYEDYDYKYVLANETISVSGLLYPIAGGIKYGDIGSIKIVIYPNYQ